MGVIEFHPDSDHIQISTKSLHVSITLGVAISWPPKVLNCHFEDAPVFRIIDNYRKYFEIFKRQNTIYFRSDTSFESWIDFEVKLSALEAKQIYTQLLRFLQTYSSTSIGTLRFQVDTKDLMKTYRIKNNIYIESEEESETSGGERVQTEEEEEEYIKNGQTKLFLEFS
jgi:hypothetical protein